MTAAMRPAAGACVRDTSAWCHSAMRKNGKKRGEMERSTPTALTKSWCTSIRRRRVSPNDSVSMAAQHQRAVSELAEQRARAVAEEQANSAAAAAALAVVRAEGEAEGGRLRAEAARIEAEVAETRRELASVKAEAEALREGSAVAKEEGARMEAEHAAAVEALKAAQETRLSEERQVPPAILGSLPD